MKNIYSIHSSLTLLPVPENEIDPLKNHRKLSISYDISSFNVISPNEGSAKHNHIQALHDEAE